ncbi:LOG family protein [uncultured Jannaschia sp.]|uniref:LOG family protein n=1 Tax=uncultured Jannaschia sp. TaxID=293347 RepID=UPI0026243E52|nr:LOG family protein [uncultured Jannaschia sp.]
MTQESRNHPLREAREDRQTARTVPDTPQTRSPAYRLAFTDDDFLCRDELRPVRLQLELMKATQVMDAADVDSTVVMFGGARVPRPENAARARTETLRELAGQYEEARRFARLVTERSLAETGGRENVVVTGGGPGVMEAGNRGAADAGGRSIGLNIVLPHEQAPNEFVTPELSFNFHYFAIRKMHFLMRAAAVCVFPGGFGTLDELFEALTLIQTGRMKRVPFLLFGEAFWRSVVNWEALEAAGTIGADDLELFRFVETAEQAMGYMDDWPLPRTRRDAIPGRVEA